MTLSRCHAPVVATWFAVLLLVGCPGARNDSLSTNNIRTAEGGTEDDAEVDADVDAEAQDAGDAEAQDAGDAEEVLDAGFMEGDAAMDAGDDPDAVVAVEVADTGAQVDATVVTEQPRCGNGVVDEGEECDQGDQNSDSEPDACRENCRLPRCGDGVADEGEQCDQGATNSDGEPDVCRTDCTSPRCGDGVIDEGEECDTGDARSDTEPGACRVDCRAAHCGDKVVDPDEGCDDGNDVDTDACRNNCVSARCGDHVVDPGEQCDDGNTTSGDGCQATCKLPICGDKVIDPGEQCDDGNTANNDGCRSDCKKGCVADSACSDGQFCNGSERCVDGLCRPAAGGPSLDDSVGCTVDACDESQDRVTHTPMDALCSTDGPSCSAATATSQTASCDATRGCIVRTTTQSCADTPSSCALRGDGSYTLTTYTPACDPQNASCGPAAASATRCTSVPASCNVGRVYTGVAAATCDPNSESCGRAAPSSEDCSARDTSRCAADNTSFTQVRGTCDPASGCGTNRSMTTCDDPPDACANGRRRTFAPACDAQAGCGTPQTTSDQTCSTTPTSCAPAGPNKVPAVLRYTPACDPQKPGECLGGGTAQPPEYCQADPSTCDDQASRIPQVTKYTPACAQDGVSCLTGGLAKTDTCTATSGFSCGAAGPKGQYQETSYRPACNADKSDCLQGGTAVTTNCTATTQTACTVVGDYATRLSAVPGCNGDRCATNGVSVLTQCRDLPVTCAATPNGQSEIRPANRCTADKIDCAYNQNSCVKGATTSVRPTAIRCETRESTGTCTAGTGCDYNVSQSLDCNSYCGALSGKTGQYLCSSAYCSIDANGGFSCQPQDTSTCTLCASPNACLANRCIPRIVVGTPGGVVLGPGVLAPGTATVGP